MAFPAHRYAGGMSRDPSSAPSSPSSPDGQSWEDSDAAWGDAPAGNDDRLLEDRPPHWDDF